MSTQEPLSQTAIGIDIGGTKIALAAVGAGSRIVARESLPTAAERGFALTVDRIACAIRDLIERAGWAGRELAGIGIGCTGPVDPRAGTINNPYTLAGWDQCDIVSPLREAFDVPVYLENDADAAALGEGHAGSGRGAARLVMITVGTGIGGGVLMDGKIYRGAGGEHPEIGHLIIARDGPECYCGARGCLESVASGTAISERGSALGIGDSRAVFARSAAGDSRARDIVQSAVAALSVGAWTLLHTFLPDCIVLGGGVIDDQYDLFAAAIRERIASATLVTGPQIRIEKAALGNDAGIIGAARLALSSTQERLGGFRSIL